MLCCQCREEIPDLSLYCLRCGAEQREAEWRPAPDQRRAATLVSQATAHVVRHEWMRAEEALREALEVDPNSASAYSLLGDIRAARGQNQEAKQWYEMSVSVRPLGGDRQKLERLRRIEEQSAEPERTEALYGSRSWIRIAIYAAAALCLMLVVSALWILATQRANRSAVPVRPVARLAVSACHLRSGFALVGRPWYLLPT